MAWVPLLALTVLLSGCAVSLSEAVPKTFGHRAVYRLEATPLVVAQTARVAAPAAPATVVDVPRLYRTLLQMPGRLAGLGQDVFWCSMFIVVIGALNAALIAALPKAIERRLERDVVRRVNASLEAMLEATKTEIRSAHTSNEPRAPATRLEPARACGCGTPVSVRSRSGLCRRCAQVARLSRQRLEGPPRPRALTASSLDENDPWAPLAPRTVARARVGECRQYYTIPISSLDQEPAPALN